MVDRRSKFGHALRGDWQFEPGIVYLNHAAFGAATAEIAAVADQWRQRIAANPTAFFDQQFAPELRRCADALAGYLHARGDDIVFVDNASTGVNAVLRSLVLMPGDEVVATNHLYRSSRRTLEFVCERAGARLLLADVPHPVKSEGDIISAILGALSPRTRLVKLDHITAYSALRVPVETIAQRCAERGIAVMVDGAHSIGNIPVDLNTLEAAGVGWYIGNCYKWLGGLPGCGFLWVHPERQGLIRPTTISNRFGEGYTPAFDWPGVKDFGSWLSVPAVLEYRQTLGEERIQNYIHGLAAEAVALLCERWGTVAGTPRQMLTAMATVALPTDLPATAENAETLRLALRKKHRIEVLITPSGGRLWVRLSAYLYNEPSDYERLAEAVLSLTGGTPIAANA